MKYTLRTSDFIALEAKYPKHGFWWVRTRLFGRESGTCRSARRVVMHVGRKKSGFEYEMWNRTQIEMDLQ